MIEDESTPIVGGQLIAEGGGQKDPAFLVELDQDFGPECHGPLPLHPAAGRPTPLRLIHGIQWDSMGKPGMQSAKRESPRNLSGLAPISIVRYRQRNASCCV